MAIPTPTYEYNVAVLRGYYEEALNDISNELLRLDISNFERSQAKSTELEIKRIISELDGKAIEWVAINIPVAALDGVALSLVSLGFAQTMQEARATARFSRLNKDFIKTAIADTQEDLLQVTKHMEPNLIGSIRSATAETVRSNLTRGINGTQTLKRDLLDRLDAATKSGIIYADGTVQKPEVYAEMVVRTKMAETQRKTAVNDAIDRDVYYGVISRHNAIDDCAKWEGKVVRLVAKAPGKYPLIDELPKREIFHPNCRHTITPIRKPERI